MGVPAPLGVLVGASYPVAWSVVRIWGLSHILRRASMASWRVLQGHPQAYQTPPRRTKVLRTVLTPVTR